MERRRIPETENKLVILYALRALGPVTGMQLIQFLAELDLMNYFTMQLSLCDMEEQGQIVRRAHPLGSLLEATREGAFTLEIFTRRIPLSRRSLIDTQAPAWRERFRTEQMTPAHVLEQPGEKAVRLRLLEGAAVLMDAILVGDDLPLTFLDRRWQLAAQTVYQAITAALTEGFSPEAPVPLGDHPALQQASRAEWLLTLQDQENAPAFTLLLTLPDEHLARFCLTRWDSCHQALRRTIVDALHTAQV